MCRVPDTSWYQTQKNMELFGYYLNEYWFIENCLIKLFSNKPDKEHNMRIYIYSPVFNILKWILWVTNNVGVTNKCKTKMLIMILLGLKEKVQPTFKSFRINLWSVQVLWPDVPTMSRLVPPSRGRRSSFWSCVRTLHVVQWRTEINLLWLFYYNILVQGLPDLKFSPIPTLGPFSLR
jgi:hypothetical protein